MKRMYKRANTVYPIIQQFNQTGYPEINQSLGKKDTGKIRLGIVQGIRVSAGGGGDSRVQ